MSRDQIAESSAAAHLRTLRELWDSIKEEFDDVVHFGEPAPVDRLSGMILTYGLCREAWRP